MNTTKKLKLKSLSSFKYNIHLILDICYFCYTFKFPINASIFS